MYNYLLLSKFNSPAYVTVAAAADTQLQFLRPELLSKLNTRRSDVEINNKSSFVVRLFTQHTATRDDSVTMLD